MRAFRRVTPHRMAIRTILINHLALLSEPFAARRSSTWRSHLANSPASLRRRSAFAGAATAFLSAADASTLVASRFFCCGLAAVDFAAALRPADAKWNSTLSRIAEAGVDRSQKAATRKGRCATPEIGNETVTVVQARWSLGEPINGEAFAAGLTGNPRGLASR